MRKGSPWKWKKKKKKKFEKKKKKKKKVRPSKDEKRESGLQEEEGRKEIWPNNMKKS